MTEIIRKKTEKNDGESLGENEFSDLEKKKLVKIKRENKNNWI